MTEEYIRRKGNKGKVSTLSILRNGMKDLPISKQIEEAARAIKDACPEIFKKEDPYPTVRMVTFKEDEVIYEITEGKSSRAKVGAV